VTFCRLAEYDNQWKMLITTGEIVPTDETLAGTWAWVRVKDHARLYRTLVEEGFIHHASMIHGDQSAVLVLACTFLGIRPVIVE
jgi:L-fucose isomerase-like protein